MTKEIKNTHVPVANVKIGYIDNGTSIEIVTVGARKFPLTKDFNGATYNILKFCDDVAVYVNKDSKKPLYFAWGIKSKTRVACKYGVRPVYTKREMGEPVAIASAKNDAIEEVNPQDPNFKSSHTLWYTWDMKTYNAEKIQEKFFASEEKIRIAKETAQKKNQEQYARENRAICGACHRHIERWDEGNNNGVIYDHGFTITGFRNGSCVGSRLQPWEKSPEGKIAYIKELEDYKTFVLRNKPTQAQVDEAKIQFNKHLTTRQLFRDAKNKYLVEYRDDRTSHPVSTDSKFFESDFARWVLNNKKENVAIVPLPEIWNQTVYPEDTLNKFITAWEHELASVEKDITDQQEMVDNWKLQLTAKEKKEGKTL